MVNNALFHGLQNLLCTIKSPFQYLALRTIADLSCNAFIMICFSFTWKLKKEMMIKPTIKEPFVCAVIGYDGNPEMFERDGYIHTFQTFEEAKEACGPWEAVYRMELVRDPQKWPGE